MLEATAWCALVLAISPWYALVLAGASITNSSISFLLRNPTKASYCFTSYGAFGSCSLLNASPRARFRLYRPMNRISAGLIVNEDSAKCMEAGSDGRFAFSTCDRFNWRQYFYPNLTSGRIVSYNNPAKCFDDSGLLPGADAPGASFQDCNATSSNQYWNATITGKDDWNWHWEGLHASGLPLVCHSPFSSEVPCTSCEHWGGLHAPPLPLVCSCYLPCPSEVPCASCECNTPRAILIVDQTSPRCIPSFAFLHSSGFSCTTCLCPFNFVGGGSSSLEL